MSIIGYCCFTIVTIILESLRGNRSRHDALKLKQLQRHELNLTQQNHITLQMMITFDFIIVRASRSSLRMMQTIPEMIHFISNETSNLETHTTWHNDIHV